MDFNHQEDETAGIVAGLLSLIALIGFVAFIVFLTSCTLTVSPDGSRTYAADPITIARAIDAFSAK